MSLLHTSLSVSLVLFLASAMFAQNAAMMKIEVEDVSGPLPSVKVSLPLSLRASSGDQNNGLSAIFQEARSSYDKAKDLLRQARSKNGGIEGTASDSGHFSLRTNGDILEVKIVEKDKTLLIKWPFSLFDAILSSETDVTFADLPDFLSTLKVPFILVGEVRSSDKLQTRFRIWIDDDGQQPPPWQP